MFALNVALLLALLLIYYLNGKDLISPSFITVSVFLLSSLFLSLKVKEWGVEITGKTILIILLFIFVFFLTELLCQTIVPNSKKQKLLQYNGIQLSKSVIILLIGLSILILYMYYTQIKKIAVFSGYNEGEDLLIQYARLGLLQKGQTTTLLISISSLFLRSLAYLNLFIFTFNITVPKDVNKRKNIIYLLIPIIYLIQYSLSGSRGAYIEFLSFFLILYIILYTKSNNGNRYNKLKIFSYTIITLLVLIIVFIYLGNLKGWAGKSVTDILSLYFGGSIAALNNFVEQGVHNNHSYGSGLETFLGVQDLFNRLNGNVSNVTRILPFTEIGNSGEMTNVYTAIRRYLSDFGLTGLIICSIIVSLFSNIMYIYIKKSNKINFLFIFYAINAMIIFYQSIDEQFFVSFLNITQIFTFLFSYILYYIFIKREM